MVAGRWSADTEPTSAKQPIVVHDRPVTFWKLIDDSGIKATVGDLAGHLRELHRLPVPDDLPLPQLDIFRRVSRASRHPPTWTTRRGSSSPSDSPNCAGTTPISAFP